MSVDIASVGYELVCGPAEGKGALIDKLMRRTASNVKYHLLEVGSGNIEILLFKIADEFHIVMFDDGWADFTVQPILTTNRIVYHPIHCVEILLRFVIWMTHHVSRHYIVIRSLDILLRWFYDFDLLFSKSACVIAKRAVFGTAWWVALDIRVEIAWSKLNVTWDVIHSDMAHDFCSVVCYCVQFRAGNQH
jgi:hypothetical protein